MTNRPLVFCQIKSLIFVATVLLVCGTIPVVVVVAFQATHFFLPNPLRSSVTKPKSFSLPSLGDAHGARLSPHSRGIIDLGRRQQRGREWRLFESVAVTPLNGTSANAFGDYAIPQQHLDDLSSSVFDEDKDHASTVTTIRVRTRRAIRRMREKYFSRPLDSRMARVLLVPMVSAVQKPPIAHASV